MEKNIKINDEVEYSVFQHSGFFINGCEMIEPRWKTYTGIVELCPCDKEVGIPYYKIKRNGDYVTFSHIHKIIGHKEVCILNDWI